MVTTRRGAAAAGGTDSADSPLTPLEAVTHDLSPQEQKLTRKLVLTVLWLLAMGYDLFVAPNHVPELDRQLYFTFGYSNAVTFALFNARVIQATLLACLMVPAMRSGKVTLWTKDRMPWLGELRIGHRTFHVPQRTNLPLWPFILASYVFGIFALLPYLILWEPPSPRRRPKVPPPPSELEGKFGWALRLAEGRMLPAVLLSYSLLLLASLIGASASTWEEFRELYWHSRLVHIATLDFAAMCVVTAFAMYVDARARNWEYRHYGVPVLGLIPLGGPAVYLLLRPTAGATGHKAPSTPAANHSSRSRRAQHTAPQGSE